MALKLMAVPDDGELPDGYRSEDAKPKQPTVGPRLVLGVNKDALKASETEPLKAGTLLTKNNEPIEVCVDGDNLVVNSHKIPLAELQGWIAPHAFFSDDVSSLQAIVKRHDDLGWELKLGDLTLKGYRCKKGIYDDLHSYLVITDETGKLRAEIPDAMLLAMIENEGE